MLENLSKGKKQYDINKKLEELGKQLPNPNEAKLSKLETLKLANAYLESLKTMLNEKEDIKVQPMVFGAEKFTLSELTMTLTAEEIAEE
ncbi:unnamed protein product [Caenorhabditis nigoni]